MEGWGRGEGASAHRGIAGAGKKARPRLGKYWISDGGSMGGGGRAWGPPCTALVELSEAIFLRSVACLHLVASLASHLRAIHCIWKDGDLGLPK